MGPILVIVGVALGLYQRLAILDRDAVIVRMDFTEGKEALTVAAIFDKRGLKRGFDTRYACEINIAFELLAVLGLVIEILNTGAAQKDDPCLFGLTGVD